MNCTDLFGAIGFGCTHLQQPDGSAIYCLSTPFQFYDGDGIHIFAEECGPAIRFFDGGDTLFHVSGSGIKFRDNRSYTPIKRLVKDAGAELSDDLEISYLAAHRDLRTGFRKVLSAMLAIADWESQNAGLATDAITLAGEVEFYLQQWKPTANIIKGEKLPGLSGREYEFAFSIEGALIDVVSSHPQSTSAEVRKLADVTGIPAQSQADITVIIDDRGDAKRASQEAAILSRFADVWMLTSLQAKVAQPSSLLN